MTVESNEVLTMDKKRWINRELRRGLWRAVREEWAAFALIGGGSGIFAWGGNYPLAAYNGLLALTFAFAIFFKNEAREGWQKANELAELLKQEGTK